MGHLRLQAALPSTIFTQARACLLLLLTLALCVLHGCGLQTNLKGAQATLPCLLQSANQRHDAALLTRYARNECPALLFVGWLNVVQHVDGTQQQQQQNDNNCQGSQLASWGRPRGCHSTSQHSTRRCGACSSRKQVAASLFSHGVFPGCKQKSAARKDAKSALELMQLQLQAALDAISSSGAASATSGGGAAAGAAAASPASSAAQPTTTQPSAAQPIFRSIPITDNQPHR